MSAAIVIKPSAATFGVWVDVTLCLPVPLHDVLAAWRNDDGDPSVDVAYRRANGEWVLTGSDPDVLIQPTHWMALPEVPVQ